MITMECYSLSMPLSERLVAARRDLGGMFAAGELAPLAEDTQVRLKALELFLLEAAAMSLEGQRRPHSGW